MNTWNRVVRNLAAAGFFCAIVAGNADASLNTVFFYTQACSTTASTTMGCQGNAGSYSGTVNSAGVVTGPSSAVTGELYYLSLDFTNNISASTGSHPIKLALAIKDVNSTRKMQAVLTGASLSVDASGTKLVIPTTAKLAVLGVDSQGNTVSVSNLSNAGEDIVTANSSNSLSVNFTNLIKRVKSRMGDAASQFSSFTASGSYVYKIFINGVDVKLGLNSSGFVEFDSSAMLTDVVPSGSCGSGNIISSIGDDSTGTLLIGQQTFPGKTYVIRGALSYGSGGTPVSSSNISAVTASAAPACASSAASTLIANATTISSTTEVVASTSPNVSVVDGALVVAATSGVQTQIELKATAPVNVVVKLPVGEAVAFTAADGSKQQVTDLTGGSLFTTVKVAGVVQLELAIGQAQVALEKTGATVSVVSTAGQSTGALVTKSDQTSLAVVKDDKQAVAFVDTGKADYTAGSVTVTIFQGENTTVDAKSGEVTELALGSLNGSKQVPGDKLPVDTPTDPATKIPKLTGTLARFDNTVSLVDITTDALRALPGGAGGQLTYDQKSGTVIYVVGTARYNLVPLGNVKILLSQPQARGNKFAGTTASMAAGTAFSLASRGIQMALSGAIGYFGDLQTALKAVDSNGQLSLKPTGAIDVRFGGGHYAVMPGVAANLPQSPNPLPGFEADASGYAVFRDHLGALQTLYPAFADADRLFFLLKTVFPDIPLTNNSDGTVTAVVSGQSIKLHPEYSLVDQPSGHPTEVFWAENGLIYIVNTDKSAQAFRAR